MKHTVRGVLIVALILVSFASGFVVRGIDPVVAQIDGEFPLLNEAIGYVEEYFVKDKPGTQEVEYALIRAYLNELDDPYSFFIEPAVAASESDALAGRYGGIGVELQRNESGDFVLFPFDDSPAARVGILSGDIIVSINGQAVDLTSTMDSVRQSLRGEIIDNAGVTLVVRNVEDPTEREYFIPFEEILVPSVIWRTLFEAPEIGYVSILSFTSRTPEEFVQAVEALRAENIQAMVLDLRGNAGGLLQESIEIAGEFFSDGLLSIERRVTGETQLSAEEGGVMLDLPIAVLVDNGTASASEIVGGAIQARGRGVLIGQETFGKGSIQRIFPLADASSIHVTTALWLTPNNQPLDGVGLVPDIPMIPDENGRDVELGEAIRYLQTQLAEQ